MVPPQDWVVSCYTPPERLAGQYDPHPPLRKKDSEADLAIERCGIEHVCHHRPGEIIDRSMEVHKR
jgi:hypothetical protein